MSNVAFVRYRASQISRNARRSLSASGDMAQSSTISAFTCASPARGAARKLLATGPIVGACWGTALILSRAWTWPVPVAAPILLGTALITTIGLLSAAAFGSRYRPAARAATAGCLGITALDASMIAVTMLVAPAVIWPIIVATAASAVRLTFTARRLRSVLAS